MCTEGNTNVDINFKGIDSKGIIKVPNFETINSLSGKCLKISIQRSDMKFICSTISPKIIPAPLSLHPHLCSPSTISSLYSSAVVRPAPLREDRRCCDSELVLDHHSTTTAVGSAPLQESDAYCEDLCPQVRHALIKSSYSSHMESWNLVSNLNSYLE
ncbi:uncharacterized protein LOC111412915 [Olea europaea var. sylvestris]|uniref:uncharacterized protein LOC111412915 n=1 Tax=Olea europaea var. sylvestris TaxID=158386 RepID=UPI000C1CE1C8|nr:uncharacterized protein LOC111412915 [Olea europaea var. sylvestris]